MAFEIEEKDEKAKVEVEVESVDKNKFVLKKFRSTTEKSYKLKFRFLNKEGQVINNFNNLIGD